MVKSFSSGEADSTHFVRVKTRSLFQWYIFIDNQNSVKYDTLTFDFLQYLSHQL